MSKTVIEMAREAGAELAELPMADAIVFGVDDLEWNSAALQRFALLVRADEREACAKLVEPNEEHRRDAIFGYLGGTEGVELLDQIATAIRARGSNT